MKLTQEDVRTMLARCGAVVTDSHFVYSAGKHGSAYVNKDAVYPHTRDVSALCQGIAQHFVLDANVRFDAVVAPAVGGVALSQWTASHLSHLQGTDVLALYAEKADSGDEFVLKRGYDKLVAGKHALIVEDVLNTGGSAEKTVRAVRACQGNVTRVAALCNRGGVTAQSLGVAALFSLLDVTMDMWEEDFCPLCRDDVPINTELGHGKAYLEQKKTEAEERIAAAIQGMFG